MNGAESLARTLVAGGVNVCFTNPGTSEMHFVAALDKVDGIRCVLGLFEGVVTGAADGYWRMADKPAATLLHLGPGLGNGLANLHNARKASSGIVNIVGEHATYHIKHDAPLTSDIEGIARPVSAWVRTSPSARAVAADGAAAIAAARTAPGQVATLILPADTAWNEADGIAPVPPAAAPAPVGTDAIERCAKALRSGEPAMLMLTGLAVRERGLALAGRIATATGARIIAQGSNARIQRGAGRVPIERLPYPVDQALAVLKDVRHLILVGAKAPVAFFAYPDKPSVLTPDGCQVHRLSTMAEDSIGALEALAEAVGAKKNGEVVQQPGRPALPTGALTPDTLAAALGALLPEGAIVSDESVTTGRGFFKATAGAPPHDWMNNMGGSIGLGLPAGHRRRGGVPRPQGRVPRGRRQRHVHAAGALDAGARRPRRDHRGLRQPHLRDPAARADRRPRGHARPQGGRHARHRPPGSRLGLAGARHGRAREPRHHRGGVQQAVRGRPRRPRPLPDRGRPLAAARSSAPCGIGPGHVERRGCGRRSRRA